MVETIGQFISRRMRELGVDEGELVRRSGLTRGTLTNVLTGRTLAPSTGTLCKLARGLGVTTRQLRTYPIMPGENVRVVTCEIPRINGIDGLRGVVFCCDRCRDYIYQPECERAACDPVEGDFASCPRHETCPCATETTPERWQDFLDWLKENYPVHYPIWKRKVAERCSK